MNTFQYNTRDYVPSVDLNTLGKTFDTLEQGHKEAVKAASDLEIVMANYDLNEDEDEWRQERINAIKQTVADNTIYGNSYAALDDLIMKAGDINSDPGLIGRLNAQKDYKAYKARIENNNSLPQRYKDYYLENNPYHYEDKYDKNGNVIGGTKWEPSSSPTNVVPISQLIVQGIQIAAKEHGEGTVTRWLDKNGHITTDPSEAFDGEVYNSTTNTWDRLSREKIWQGINSMIDNTPGARESIKQDYDVAVWDHNKKVKANNGKPLTGDVTDENGKLLTQEEYLFKRIDPAAQTASYYNATSNTTAGRGLITYRAAEAAREKAAAMAEASSEEAINKIGNALSTKATPVKVDIDMLANFDANKGIAKKHILDLYNKATGNKGSNSFSYNLINEAGNNGNMPISGIVDYVLKQTDIPSNVKREILAYAKVYDEATENLKVATEGMSDRDKQVIGFAARMKSGGKLLSKANGGSDEDDKIISYRNALYGTDGKTLVINLGDKTAKNVDDIINSGKYDNYKDLGTYKQGNQIFIPRDNSDVLPMIASIVTNAEDRANKGFWGTIYQSIPGKYRFTVDILDSNGVSVYKNWKPTGEFSIGTSGGQHNFGSVPQTAHVYNIRKMSNEYNWGIKMAETVRNKNNIIPSTITIGSLNLDGETFTDATLLDQCNKGLISNEQYLKNKTYYSNSIESSLKNTDFSQTKMFYSKGGGDRELVTESNKRFNYGAKILQAFKDGRATFSPSIVPIASNITNGSQIAGYNFQILPKPDDDGNIDSKDIESFYIPGLTCEAAIDNLVKSSSIQAFSSVAITGETNSTRLFTTSTSNPGIGRSAITGLNGSDFQIEFAGMETRGDSKEAVNFTIAVNDYLACKNTLLSGYDKDMESRLRNTIDKSAITIGTIFNVDPNAVLIRLYDDLSK